MDNLEYWNKLCRPPEQAMKTIKAGRLKGMSDINPQWRVKAMTDAFGPCGVGWKFNLAKQWLEDGTDGEQPVRCAFVNIELSILHDGVWSEPIPGTGGSMLVAKEKYGPHTSDEAFKMATTDALSTAMKMLGVAADIYMGMFDGSKYTTPPPQQAKPDPKSNPDYEQASKLLVDKQGSMPQKDIDRCQTGIADGKCQAVIDYLKGL